MFLVKHIEAQDDFFRQPFLHHSMRHYRYKSGSL
jgi:hypothetical protein